MAASTSRHSFLDCFDLFERAIADATGGVRVRFDAYGTANHFRTRLHKARQIDRDDNRETYAQGHAMHGRSVFDAITATIDKEGPDWWLYLRKHDLSKMEVQSLGHIEETVDAEPVPEIAASRIESIKVDRRI